MLLAESTILDIEEDEEEDDDNLWGRGQRHPFTQQKQQKRQPTPLPLQQRPSGPGPAYLRKYGSRASSPPNTPSSSSLGFPSLRSSFGASSNGKREGLRNLGNTCYLNATVQALAAAGGFGDELASDFWVKETKADLLPPQKPPPQKGQQEGSASAKALAKQPQLPLQLRVYGSLLGLVLRLRTKGHGVLDPTLFRQVRLGLVVVVTGWAAQSFPYRFPSSYAIALTHRPPTHTHYHRRWHRASRRTAPRGSRTRTSSWATC